VIGMPIHDWIKAPSGYFHHFHQNWSVGMCAALNGGLLPKGIFALVEQHSGAVVPDILALEMQDSDEPDWSHSRGGLALATDPPKTRFLSRESQEVVYAARANRIAVHKHDETIAVIEIVSPGNKASERALEQFVEKSVEFLEGGIHLLVVDLFPPTRRDPQGIHPVIWAGINDEPFALPADQQLTLASYVAGEFKTAYVEPVAVGGHIPDMPLFLDSKHYVSVPLESTYQATWIACPEEFKQRVAGR
jgi:hypothetical protein